jgi:hypothetical protein
MGLNDGLKGSEKRRGMTDSSHIANCMNGIKFSLPMLP